MDERLVELFNRAAAAGRDGDPEQSLALYREAIARATGPDPLAASGDFIATVHMRAAFCLMDLVRYDDALAELDQAARLIDELDTDGQYEYFFARGNTLGQLGRLDDSFAALVEAISRAEDQDDYVDRPARCWTCILGHAARLEHWPFLRYKAAIALNTARLRGIPELERLASDALAAMAARPRA